jgi:hypothetical protein
MAGQRAERSATRPPNLFLPASEAKPKRDPANHLFYGQQKRHAAEARAGKSLHANVHPQSTLILRFSAK